MEKNVQIRVIVRGLAAPRTDDMKAMLDDLIRHGAARDRDRDFRAALDRVNETIREVVRSVNESAARIREYGRCWEEHFARSR